ECKYQALRRLLEGRWVPEMQRLLRLEAYELPVIWDADFLYGPRMPGGDDTYVLCEINVSSVFAIPDQAPAAIARLVWERLHDRTR
ncbi:MAG TPA: hypothetical protein VFT77_17265, partial [Reyranella sp.]|nr:hypothetical protein [Reyranella sp.]